MNQNEDTWIEEVLESTKGMARAQAPDSIAFKINQKINTQEAKIINLRHSNYKWLAAAVLLLVGLNVALLTQHSKKLRSYKGNRNTYNSEYSFGSNEIIKF